MVRARSWRRSTISKVSLAYDPDQQLLLPQALQEWLPEGHLAYFISDVVDQLDLCLRRGRLSRRSRIATGGSAGAGRLTTPG